MMHIDYVGLRHYIWEEGNRLDDSGLPGKEVDTRIAGLEKMAHFFQDHRIGAIKK